MNPRLLLLMTAMLTTLFFLTEGQIRLSEISGSHAGSMKMAVSSVVAPCSMVEVYRRFRRAFCLHHQGDHLSDDGGSKYL
jgi:hypothetical protein